MNIHEISVKEVNSDVRAEVIAADLVEGGLDLDSIVISPLGLAERIFRKDIAKIESRQDKLGIKDMLFIDVTREGIYNALPEALFHFDPSRTGTGSAAFVEQYKRHRAEEEAAKQFFLATEKELYRVRILNELVERKSMLGFSDQFKSELFLNLWPELGDISDKYLPSMLLLLPISHKIVGNLDLAGMLISYAIDQPLKLKYSDNTRPVHNYTNSNNLGETYLGLDCIIGTEVPDYTPLLEVTVGPVKKGELMKFMPGGEIRKVLDLACKYMFPAAMDINICIALDIMDEKLILSTVDSDARLGSTTRL